MKIHDVLLDKISDDFPSSIVDVKIAQYCKTLNAYLESHKGPHDWFFLMDKVSAFHRRHNMPMTSKQYDCYNTLKDSDTSIILLPYQPNAFPSFCVLSLFVAMDIVVATMKRIYGKQVVPIYLIVDYDVAGDKRFQGSFYPSLLTPYTGSVKFCTRKYKYKAMFDTPLPSYDVINAKFNCLMMELHYISSSIKVPEVVKRCDELMKFIQGVSAKVKSITGLNELILYYINSFILDTGVLFVEGHKDYNLPDGACVRPLLELMKYKNDIVICYNEFKSLMKSHCIDCSFDEGGCYSLWGYSVGDSMRTRIQFKSLDTHIFKYDYLFPNVLFDYLMDYKFYHKNGGIGYYKQAEMTLLSDYIAKKVFNWDPVPQLLLHCHYDFSDVSATLGLFFMQDCNKRKLLFRNYLSVFEDSHSCSLFYLLLFGGDAIRNHIQKKY